MRPTRALDWVNKLSGLRFRLDRQKGVPVDFEEPCLLFTSGFAESVARLADPHVDEADVVQHCPPTFARKAAGDSSSPKIDIAYCALRHRLAVGYISEL